MFTLRLEPLDAANTQAVSATANWGTQPQAEAASLLETEGPKRGHGVAWPSSLCTPRASSEGGTGK